MDLHPGGRGNKGSTTFILTHNLTFGNSLESQNFFLLHISLLREYINLEFQSIENSLNFSYDLERIIDDFVLLSVFVGNDFLPHLPDLHIHNNALEQLFVIYKQELPRLGIVLFCIIVTTKFKYRRLSQR